MNQKQYNLDSFYHGLEKLNITLSNMQVQQFLDYYELLIEWNKVMNLTGITEFEEVIEKHFLDSLCAVKVYDFKKNVRVMDLGTGAGLPGIPLKIVFPEIEMTLADSLNKRIKFLDEVIKHLGLTNISTIHARAEELARKPEHRESYDLCVSRAVANLSSLSEYCLPFVKQDGFFLSYKSAEIDEEVKQAEKAISILGGQIDNVAKFTLPNSEDGRSFVTIKKKKLTPKKYPRKAGTPAKEPLK